MLKGEMTKQSCVLLADNLKTNGFISAAPRASLVVGGLKMVHLKHGRLCLNFKKHCIFPEDD